MEIYLEIIIFILFFSTIYLLFYIKDIINRKENIFLWGLIIILTGPIGLTFYLSDRKLIEGEERKEKRICRLAKNFIPSWTKYILLGSILAFLMMTIYDSLTFDLTSGFTSRLDYILESLFWMVIMLVIVIIPFLIIIPISIAYIIKIITEKSK